MEVHVNLWCLVPARGGSKGLPGKNLKEISGRSLTRIAVERCLDAGFSRVFIASDDEDIIAEAVKYGAECPEVRPAEISQDGSHMYETYRWALEVLQGRGEIVDALLTTLPTTPFVPADALRNAGKKIAEPFDWVFTVNEFEHHPYRAMEIDENRLIPHADVPPDVFWSNRQQLPTLYRFNGGVIAGTAKTIVEHPEYNIGRSLIDSDDVSFEVVTPLQGLDIDTEVDLEIARVLEEKYSLFS